MSDRPFRFVHAADFHLETPLGGVTEVPDHLRDLFMEAPYTAAERVFEAALAEEAEFLVLSGDILHPQLTGPRGPLFLMEQFQRLAARQVAVYWAGGRVDPPEAWPEAVKLPDNVHVFPTGRPEESIHRRDSVAVARLVGASRSRGRTARAGDFEADPSGAYSIAVVHGRADAESLRGCPETGTGTLHPVQGRDTTHNIREPVPVSGQPLRVGAIDYWALGGNHTRHTLFSSPNVAHYPGSPQGRRPEDTGPHGCTLVAVDQQRRTRTTPIPTDCLRWHHERIMVEPANTRAELELRLRDRLRGLVESSPATDLLVSWTIAGNGPLLAALRQGKLAGELLAALRDDAQAARHSAWSVSLTAEPCGALAPEWYQQETILGDFLREVRHCQTNPDEPLDLDSYVSREHAAGAMGSMLDVADPATRQRVLCEAAMLGVDLLSGEGPPS